MVCNKIYRKLHGGDSTVSVRKSLPAKHTRPAGVKHSTARPLKETAPARTTGGRSQRRSDVRKNVFGGGRTATQKRGH